MRASAHTCGPLPEQKTGPLRVERPGGPLGAACQTSCTAKPERHVAYAGRHARSGSVSPTGHLSGPGCGRWKASGAGAAGRAGPCDETRPRRVSPASVPRPGPQLRDHSLDLPGQASCASLVSLQHSRHLLAERVTATARGTHQTPHSHTDDQWVDRRSSRHWPGSGPGDVAQAVTTGGACRRSGCPGWADSEDRGVRGLRTSAVPNPGGV
jgi:hypothetical protein